MSGIISLSPCMSIADFFAFPFHISCFLLILIVLLLCVLNPTDRRSSYYWTVFWTTATAISPTVVYTTDRVTATTTISAMATNSGDAVSSCSLMSSAFADATRTDHSARPPLTTSVSTNANVGSSSSNAQPAGAFSIGNSMSPIFVTGLLLAPAILMIWL